MFRSKQPELSMRAPMFIAHQLRAAAICAIRIFTDLQAALFLAFFNRTFVAEREHRIAQRRL
jgi:hypothetical protein